MPNRTTNISTAVTDQRAWELRQQGTSWGTIAQLLGMRNESSARTAGNRHARRIGAAHGYVAPTGRTTGRGTRTATPVVASDYTRTFGVEIEFNGRISQQAAADAINAAGYRAVVESYNHQTRGYWKIITDASCGYEAVSPILSGEAGLAEIKGVMRALKAAGAEVDIRCGMHVHVGSDDLTNDQRARVIEMYMAHHDTINRFVAPSRRSTDNYTRSGTTNYCRVPTTQEVTTWANCFRAGHRSMNAPRYVTINVTSYVKYGTIEFRQHQGTLNGRKAVAWIRLLLGIYRAVEAGTDRGIPTGLAMLGALADGDMMTRDAATYLMSRADVLAPVA